MKHGYLPNILIEEGYVITYGPKNNNHSSVVPGGVATIYEKGDSKFIWGLGEPGHAPYLLSPKPDVVQRTTEKIIDGVKCFVTNSGDSFTRECLETFGHRAVYDGIMNGSKFDLLTKNIINYEN